MVRLTLRGTKAAYSALFILAMVSLMACSQEPAPSYCTVITCRPFHSYLRILCRSRS